MKIVGFRCHCWQIEVIQLSRRELVAIVKLLVETLIGLQVSNARVTAVVVVEVKIFGTLI